MHRVTLERKLLYTLSVTATLALVGGSLLELNCRKEEATVGLRLPWDQPGRKYALTGGGGKNTRNSLGFNDREFTVAKPPGVTRVAIFGDSLTFGSGIPQTSVYPAVAEAILRERGQSVEIYNFSVYGYDIEQVAATLHYVGWAYAPDLVVYAYFTNDDFPSELLTLADGHTPIFIGTSIRADLALGFPSVTLLGTRYSAAMRRWVGARVARARASTVDVDDRTTVRAQTGGGGHDAAFFGKALAGMKDDADAHDTPLVAYGMVPHVLANRDLAQCGAPVRPSGFCSGQLVTLHDAWSSMVGQGIPFVSSVPWLQSEGREAYWPEANPQDEIHAGVDGHRVLGRGLADLVSRWKAGETLLAAPEPLPAGVGRAGKGKHPGGGKRRREAGARQP